MKLSYQRESTLSWIIYFSLIKYILLCRASANSCIFKHFWSWPVTQYKFINVLKMLRHLTLPFFDHLGLLLSHWITAMFLYFTNVFGRHIKFILVNNKLLLSLKLEFRWKQQQQQQQTIEFGVLKCFKMLMAFRRKLFLSSFQPKKSSLTACMISHTNGVNATTHTTYSFLIFQFFYSFFPSFLIFSPFFLLFLASFLFISIFCNLPIFLTFP